MELFLSQLLGCAIGILSSWIFWRFLLLMKPNIAISPQATYSQKKDGKGIFKVKIINKGHRQITDIQALLSISERVTYKRGTSTLKVICNLPLVKDSILALASIDDLDKPWVLPTVYTFRTKSESDVWDLLNTGDQEKRRLVFTISMSDALSGTKVVKRIAYKPEDVIPGSFGKDFHIRENDEEDNDNELD